MDPITVVERKIKPLARIGAIFGVIAAVGVAYWFYLDNIWRPDVVIKNVDYEKGIAEIEQTNMFGKKHTRTLYSGSTISAGGHWGVRFAGEKNERIELVKNDITYKTLSLKKEA